METSDLLNMSNEIGILPYLIFPSNSLIEKVNISDPVEDSEALRAPKGRLKRLQKKNITFDDGDESNNDLNLSVRGAETASEIHSMGIGEDIY